MILDTQTIEQNGKAYQVKTILDADHGMPWQEHDGHGPVTGWERRDKMPGELILAEDRGARLFYDFAEACRIARADGWDAKPYNTGQESKRQQAAKAARADFEYLQKWCAGDLHWIGVSVTKACPCCNAATGDEASLWGIESNAGDYLDDVAHELIDQLAH